MYTPAMLSEMMALMLPHPTPNLHAYNSYIHTLITKPPQAFQPLSLEQAKPLPVS